MLRRNRWQISGLVGRLQSSHRFLGETARSLLGCFIRSTLISAARVCVQRQSHTFVNLYVLRTDQIGQWRLQQRYPVPMWKLALAIASESIDEKRQHANLSRTLLSVGITTSNDWQPIHTRYSKSIFCRMVLDNVFKLDGTYASRNRHVTGTNSGNKRSHL